MAFYYDRRVKINKKIFDFYKDDLDEIIDGIVYLTVGIFDKKNETTHFKELKEALRVGKKLYLNEKYGSYVEKRIYLDFNFSEYVEEFDFLTKFNRADLGLFFNSFLYLLKEEAFLKFFGFERSFDTFNEFLSYLIKYKNCDECVYFIQNKVAFVYFVLFGETKI